jgi:hypothetical protein
MLWDAERKAPWVVLKFHRKGGLEHLERTKTSRDLSTQDYLEIHTPSHLAADTSF